MPRLEFSWKTGGSSYPALLVFVLVTSGLIWFVLGDTISCYFLADDVLHLPYLWEAFSRSPAVLLEKLVTPWQDQSVQLLWRPLGTVLLALDYFFSGANPVGYHIGNLVIYYFTCLAFFLCCRKLLDQLPDLQANAAAIFAALLFAVHPLHLEVVIWIVGCLDGMCAGFCFASFYFYLRHRQVQSLTETPALPHLLAISLALFVAGLFAKEAAVSLALAIFAYNLVNQPGSRTFKERIFASLRQIYPYLKIFIVYAIARALVLHSLLGGYIGSIGASFRESFFERILSLLTIPILFLPLNIKVFPSSSFMYILLEVLYAATILFLLVRVISGAIGKRRCKSAQPQAGEEGAVIAGSCSLTALPGTSAQSPGREELRLLVFSCLWFLGSLLPALPTFYVTPTLINSRLLYQASAPACLLFSLLVLSAVPFKSWTTSADLRRSWWFRAACLLLLSFIIAFAFASYRQGRVWLAAGEQLAALRAAIVKELAGLPDRGRIFIVNLPRHHQGVQVLYTFKELQCLLKPPLSQEDFSGRVVGMEDRSGQKEDVANRSRLFRVAADNKEPTSFFFWDLRRKTLVPAAVPLLEDASPALSRDTGSAEAIELPVFQKRQEIPDSAAGQRRVLVERTGDAELVAVIDPPLPCKDIEYLEAKIAARPVDASFFFPPERRLLSLNWNPDSSSDGESRDYGLSTQAEFKAPCNGSAVWCRCHVGEYWSWNTQNTVSRILISTKKKGTKLELLGLRFHKWQGYVPAFALDDQAVEEGKDGIFHPASSKLRSVAFSYDLRGISQAQSALIEISKPGYIFHFWVPLLHETTYSPGAMRRVTLPGRQGVFNLDFETLPEKGQYQLRVLSLKQDGSPVGGFSDPITIDVPLAGGGGHAIKLESPGAYFLECGWLRIKWYGVFLAAGFAAACIAVFRTRQFWGLSETQIGTGILYCLLGGMIGARLYYVLIRWSYFAAHPDRILALMDGGLTIHGCLLGVALAAFIFCRSRRLAFARVCDCVATVLPLAQAIWRWGNFFNSEAFGKPLSSGFPIGLFVAPEYRPQQYAHFDYFHPAFLYESIWNAAIFVCLYFWLAPRLRHIPFLITCIYLVSYSLGRLLIEPLRLDSVVWNGLPVPVLASLACILIGLAGGIVIALRSSCGRGS